jgi:hypothetical protein
MTAQRLLDGTDDSEFILMTPDARTIIVVPPKLVDASAAHPPNHENHGTFGQVPLELLLRVTQGVGV